MKQLKEDLFLDPPRHPVFSDSELEIEFASLLKRLNSAELSLVDGPRAHKRRRTTLDSDRISTVPYKQLIHKVTTNPNTTDYAEELDGIHNTIK